MCDVWSIADGLYGLTGSSHWVSVVGMSTDSRLTTRMQCVWLLKTHSTRNSMQGKAEDLSFATKAKDTIRHALSAPSPMT